jgi:hypothetical protein
MLQRHLTDITDLLSSLTVSARVFAESRQPVKPKHDGRADRRKRRLSSRKSWPIARGMLESRLRSWMSGDG